ncbi:apolipoprotein L1-like isoform X2 [Protopterus annectens]|uniref:apolipoprotein L1-like isoform X2 n=1 Tax=Protopterus annectens TaxID=7888 RepID=UPI001CFBF422|nr:apolipoprotein L1-like isoform X2 [Protopterus annectens]
MISSLEMSEVDDNKSNEVNLDSIHKTVKDIDDFQKMLSPRIASFENKIQQLEKIADNLDSFHKGAVVARIAGSSVSAAGGITALTGLMLAPFTFGVSVVVAGVGVGISVLGGAASATSFIADSSTQKENCKKVKEIIVSYFQEADDIYKCLASLGEEFEKIEKMDERFSSKYINMKNSKAEEGDPDVSLDEVAAFLGLAGAARAGLVAFHAISKLARAFTGVLSGMFLALDAYLLVKDARELSEGASTETVDHIRKVAVALKESLNDLNDSCANIAHDGNTLWLLYKISQNEENSEPQEGITTHPEEAT